MPSDCCPQSAARFAFVDTRRPAFFLCFLSLLMRAYRTPAPSSRCFWSLTLRDCVGVGQRRVAPAACHRVGAVAGCPRQAGHICLARAGGCVP
eukprot:5138612-Amphidinium_carterae.4